MVPTDELINKGLILGQWSGRPGRTFIVTGLFRWGTKDEALSAALLEQDSVALERIIALRNLEHS